MKLELISSDRCPFVQRSVVALEEKKVPYELILLDPYDPPEWFSKISPLGKVPVLRIDDDAVLFESAVINEYLDETTPGQLHPEAPLQRALNRSWIEFGGGMLSDTFKIMSVATETEFNEVITNLTGSLQRISDELDDTGPFFNGPNFSLVDAAYAPLFVRLSILGELIDLDITSDMDKIGRWQSALLTQPSVKVLLTPVLKTRFLELMAEKNAWAQTRLSKSPCGSS